MIQVYTFRLNTHLRWPGIPVQAGPLPPHPIEVTVCLGGPQIKITLPGCVIGLPPFCAAGCCFPHHAPCPFIGASFHRLLSRMSAATSQFWLKESKSIATLPENFSFLILPRLCPHTVAAYSIMPGFLHHFWWWVLRIPIHTSATTFPLLVVVGRLV